MPRAVLGAVLGAALGALVLAGCGGDGGEPNPFTERAMYVDPDSRTAQGADQAAAAGDTRRAELLQRLAEVPQGIWLTPERQPAGTVGGYVSEVVAAAKAQGRVVVLVVYGIEDRDCTGSYSAGGLAGEAYRAWVQELAGAAEDGSRVVAVLEPDALASAPECGNREHRVEQVREAARALRDAGVATYLDGGHSGWVPAGEMAELLREAGVEEVRGFATNVSNYQSDADEREYAEEVSGQLDGAAYVIDRGRNGAGGTSQWCNPPDQALGEEPGYVDEDGLDAYLWVKPPGESDGTCNGGPPAGELWPERAQAMAERAGW